jgi:hypothetical protein
MLIKEDLAEKLFGDGSAIGKTVTIEDHATFTVAGIVAEPAGKTHLTFDMLASFRTLQDLPRGSQVEDWRNTWTFATYARVDDAASIANIESLLAGISARRSARRRCKDLCRLNPREPERRVQSGEEAREQREPDENRYQRGIEEVRRRNGHAQHLKRPEMIERRHVVQEDEWLAVLARRYYNDLNMWPRIWLANRDRLSNPDSVDVGVALLIPERKDPPTGLRFAIGFCGSTGAESAPSSARRVRRACRKMRPRRRRTVWNRPSGSPACRGHTPARSTAGL